MGSGSDHRETGAPSSADGRTRGRLLVTGATGSLGPSVVAAARAAGWTVRVLVRRPMPWPEDVEVAMGDVRDIDAVREAVAGCDVVVHLAGIAHRKGPDADATHEGVTRDGARNVFAAAEAARCRRVVFASTIAVYGTGGCFDEGSPRRPTGAYAAAKAAAEDDLRRRTGRDGGPLGTTLRLATCYGPGADSNVTTMLDALDRRRFVLVGSGENRKTLLHVDDAAAAVVLVADHPRAAGATYDVSDGSPLPLRDIVDAMADELGRPPPIRVPAAPLRLAVAAAARGFGALGRTVPVDAATVDTLVADIAVPAARIRDDLGFTPAFDLRSGIASVVATRGAQHASAPADGDHEE